MKSIIKQSSSVLALYYIGRALSFLSTAYILPWALGVEMLGLYVGIQSLGFVFSRFSIGPAIIRYFVRLQDNQRKKAVFFTGVLLTTTLIYALALTPFLFWKQNLVRFFSKHAAEVTYYMPMIMLLGYLMVLNITIKSWYIALKKIIWPNFLQHIILPIFINGTVVMYAINLLSFQHLILLLIIPYTFNLLLLIGYLARIGELKIHWDLRCFNKTFIRSFLTYSFFMLISTNLILVLTRVDTVMILGMCSKKEAGIYRIITFVVLLLNIPVKALNQASSASIASMLAKNAYSPLDDFYKKITLYQCFFSCLLFSLIYTSLPYVFYAFPSNTLDLVRKTFVILAIGEIIYNLFDVSHLILIFSRYFKLNLITFALLLVGVLANYIMISLWGITGAAIATFFTLTGAGSVTCFIVWHKLNIHPFSLRLLAIINSTILNLVAHTFFPLTTTAWLNTILWIAITLVLYGILLLIHRKYPPRAPI